MLIASCGHKSDKFGGGHESQTWHARCPILGARREQHAWPCVEERNLRFPIHCTGTWGQSLTKLGSLAKLYLIRQADITTADHSLAHLARSNRLLCDWIRTLHHSRTYSRFTTSCELSTQIRIPRGRSRPLELVLLVSSLCRFAVAAESFMQTSILIL